MLQTGTVKTATLGLLKALQAESVLVSARLVGGTALSLQIGHRESDDEIKRLLLKRYPAYDPIIVDKAIIYLGDIDDLLVPEIKMLGYVFDFLSIQKRIVKMTDNPDKIYSLPPLKKK